MHCFNSVICMALIRSMWHTILKFILDVGFLGKVIVLILHVLYIVTFYREKDELASQVEKLVHRFLVFDSLSFCDKIYQKSLRNCARAVELIFFINPNSILRYREFKYIVRQLHTRAHSVYNITQQDSLLKIHCHYVSHR